MLHAKEVIHPPAARWSLGARAPLALGSWSLLLVLSGWLLDRFYPALLWPGLFLLGAAFGAFQPPRFYVAPIAALWPCVSAAWSPYFSSSALRWIAAGIAVALPLSGAVAGRLVRRIAELAWRVTLEDQDRRELAARLGLLICLTSIGALAATDRVVALLGFWPVMGALLMSVAVVSFALSEAAIDAGSAGAFAFLVPSILPQSNLAPFELLAGLITAGQLMAAAIVGRSTANVVARRRRSLSTKRGAGTLGSG